MLQAGNRLRLDDRAASEVFDEWDSFPPRQLRNLLRHRRLDESAHVEIAVMHFQDHRGFARDAPRIIIDRGLVGRAHFAKPRAAGFQNFRNAEPAANLNQLAAGNDDFIFLPVHSLVSAARTRTGIRRSGLAEMPQD